MSMAPPQGAAARLPGILLLSLASAVARRRKSGLSWPNSVAEGVAWLA